MLPSTKSIHVGRRRIPNDVSVLLLCGDRGGLVCITVNFVTCLCLFTDFAKLHGFLQSQPTNAPPDLAFPLEVAFATCHDASELIDRLNVAEKELAASKVDHLAINP